MSEILNRAGINAVLGAGSVVLNDYALNITPIERGYRLTVKRGSETQTMDILDGVGIVGIEKTGSTGDVDSYRVTFTDGSTFKYTVETNAAAHAAAEAARVEAEKSRAGAEVARESAEAGRVNAEDARVEADAARESAETARASAESARAQAEDGRQSAEAARVAAEQSRASAESVRAAAENARVAAETARTNAENERAGAEALRSAEETDRANAESGRVSAEQGRVSAESERVAAEEARATEFAGFSGEITQLKDDVAAITPDDTVVDGKPWTSKKTVDSLCMPIEETGNPVQVYPVEGYPLGVKVSLEPTQAGSGDPSPDNIRPITGRDAVSVTRCGKNLFSTKNGIGVSTAGITNATIEDNRIVLSRIDGGTWLAYRAYFDIPAGIYTVSVQATCSDEAFTPTLSIYYRDKDTGVTRVITSINGTGAKTIEVPDGNFVGFYAHLSLDVSYTGERTVEYSNIQLELGSTATAYEAYIGSTTDIALPETVYGGTLDLETGVVTIDWIFNHTVLGDTSALPGAGDGFVRKTLKGDKNVMLGSSNQHCNVAPYSYEYNGGYTHFYIDTNGYAMIVLPVDTPADTVIQTANKTKVPYTIQLTPQQIAALSGVNTLYTDAGTLTVTGREDPRHTIVELKNAIISLGGNI